MESAEAVDRSKHVLRRSLLAARLSRSESALADARAHLRQQVLTEAAASGWHRVAAYEPLRTEPGSVELLDDLVAAGVRVLVPITRPDRDLDWRDWPVDGPPLGLSAVSRVDAVLVPALAVSRAGVRLGRGGGSYDRALTRVPSSVPVAALLFDDELVDELPYAPWDVPVGALARPCGWTTL